MSRTALPARPMRWLSMFAACVVLAACKSTHVRTTTDFESKVSLSGKTLVLVEPAIQLYELKASGMAEPKADWTRQARTYFSQAVNDMLSQQQARRAPDYYPPRDLPVDHKIRQVLALNDAVMGTIFQHSYLHVPLPTRGTARRKPLSWTLGPGVREIGKITGADYMLTVQISDSYSSAGRVAMMIAGLALQVALLSGGQQGGIATLVDLNTGEVVWFNVMVDQLGDMRDPEGAAVTAARLLKGLPL